MINIDTDTGRDLYAAGSRVTVNGNIDGKARLAGADLQINAEIGEMLHAAAASIDISKEAQLATDASLAAALIEFHGSANDNLHLYADEVKFSGHAMGSVTIEGRDIELNEAASIDGDLIIRSSKEAEISPNANVAGTITHTGLEESEIFNEHENVSDGIGFFILLSASAFLLGSILIIFVRNFVEQDVTTLRTQPCRSILWGIAVFFGLPVVAIVTMITIIGIPMGIAILLLLPFLLILGYFTLALGTSEWILNRNNEHKNIGQHLLFFSGWCAHINHCRFHTFFWWSTNFYRIVNWLRSSYYHSWQTIKYQHMKKDTIRILSLKYCISILYVLVPLQTV